MGVLIVRDNTCRADTTKGREGGSHKIGEADDSTLSNAAEQSSYVQSCKHDKLSQVWNCNCCTCDVPTLYSQISESGR